MLQVQSSLSITYNRGRRWNWMLGAITTDIFSFHITKTQIRGIMSSNTFNPCYVSHPCICIQWVVALARGTSNFAKGNPIFIYTKTVWKQSMTIQGLEKNSKIPMQWNANLWYQQTVGPSCSLCYSGINHKCHYFN